MKNYLLSAFLMVTAFASAQDYDYIAALKTISGKDSAIKIGNEITSMSTTKLRLYKVNEVATQKNLRLQYVPAELTDNDMENRKYTSDQLQQITVIDFKYFDNVSGTPGTTGKAYKLNNISAPYSTIFPFWQKHFKPDAETEKTLTDYKSQHLKDNDKKVNFSIRKEGKIWTLINQS